MISHERSASAPDGAATIASDADFQARWAEWVERGRVHDERVRHRFIRSAWLLAVGAAVALAFVR